MNENIVERLDVRRNFALRIHLVAWSLACVSAGLGPVDLYAQSEQLQPEHVGQIADGAIPSDRDATIEFIELSTSPIREGYFTLAWTELDQADRYDLLSGTNVLYQGRLPKGFVSGLDNGQHALRVLAWNRAGDFVGESDVAKIEVKHWPLPMALGLFSVGAVVMLALFATLTIGTIRTRSTQAQPKSNEEQSTSGDIP